jgi:hypothetical protein
MRWTGAVCPLLITLSMPFASRVHAQTPAANQGSSPSGRAIAVQVEHGPKMDGKLDDAIWRAAQWITEFVQREPHEGQPASEPMRVAFVYDDHALYIGARMDSRDPNAVRALITRRDREETSDQLLVSFDTYRDGRTAYTFAVTSAGVRIDYYHARDFETQRDYTYDPVWQAETERDERGWSAEIRIPFTQLRFNSAEQQLWGVNVVRSTPATNEIVFWRLIGRNETGWASRMGELAGIEGIAASRRVELLPYVATEARVTSQTVAGNPFSKESEANARVGGDLKMGLGPSLTLDATFNPDFGQVEADPAEVNLSAYETFFAERRPFFLEGTQLLASRGNFYSRRIGARPISSVPGATYVEPIANATILGAAKVTGRNKSGVSLAALTAVTAEETARTFDATSNAFGSAVVAPLTAYGVVAMQKEFGSSARTSSNLYGIFTAVERDLGPDSYLSTLLAERAYTGIVDYRIRWKGGQYDMSTFFAWSWLNGDTLALQNQQTSSRRYFQRPDADYVEVDGTRTSMFGTYFGINHSKLSGKHWLWDVDYWQEAPSFELNDVGRLGTADDRGMSVDLVYRQNEPGKIFRNYALGLWTGSEWNFGGVRQYTYIQSFNSAQLKNYWQINANLTHGIPSLSDNLTRGGPLMGVDKNWEFYASFNNRPGSRNRWRGSTTLFRDARDTWSASVSGGVSYRPGAQWEISIDPRFRRNANTRQYITTMNGGRAETFGRRYVFSTVDQSELAARMRVNYAITPDLTLETYLEPFASSGRFYDFGELPEPRSYDLRYYGTDGTTISAPDAQGERQVTDGASSFTIANSDFNVRSFRSNMVVRWEWRPGSTLFLVWQQNRSESDPSGGHVRPRTVWDALSARGSNFFAIKMNYWLPVH